MNLVAQALRAAISDLRDLGARFALVGGWAVSARAEPRFTRAVDLAVAVDGDAGAEALVAALRDRGYRAIAIVEHEKAERLATARLLPPAVSEPGLMVDLLFASSGIEAEIVSDAGILEILPGITAPISQRGHLVALKLLSREDRHRPQDAGDLRALLRGIEAAELERTRAAIDLITRRGFNRSKDLSAELERAIGDAAS